MKATHWFYTMKYGVFSLFLFAQTAQAQEQQLVVRDGEEEEKAISFPARQKLTGDIETQIQNLQFTQAEEKLKKDITLAKRKKKDTAALEGQLEQCTRGIQMLRGTDKVTIIDSIVVDKRSFLDGYKFPPDLGKVRISKDGKSTEFETERGNHIYKSEMVEGKLQLVSYDMENGQPINPKTINGLDVDGDLNYPFLMSDGITFYFAARSSEGLGNYDLYVTRYDYDEDKFYKAENLGFPYNSYANDYLMAIDEENKLGWFASDRYQPNGKVCIYTFIPNTSRHPYDYENEDRQVIINAASLRSFKTTWNKDNEQARIQAKQTLAFITARNTAAKPHEFTLVINDNFTYHYYSDFRSAEAKKQCREWVQKQSNFKKLQQQLETLRNQYTSANDSKRRSMKNQIVDLEKQSEKLFAEMHEAEKKTRNLELK